MSVLHVAADDLRVGDVIVHDGGETPVRVLDRSAAPTIVTNPGGEDEVSGYVWQHVQIRREERTA
ncbi:hypothetical protein [Streptomyces sp. NPDC060188]|uniref:hypothetical protein n=1 Tax=Streptomyces sp. NPDC060188 TaxID=3347068 RepID=UPI00364E5B06